MESYGRFAAVYDRLMEDMPYDAWVEFAEEAWRRYMPSKPERIVDLGCGTGNIALPLAARGYALAGIDLSETMLAVAEQKAASAPVKSGSIRWLCQDMREWNAGEPADAVVSFCDCLNYITEEADVRKVFAATYRQLRPGGVFLFDVHHPRQFESYADGQPFAYDDDDLAYIWFCDYDEARREIEHQLTFFIRQDAGSLFERVDEAHVQRAYETEAMASWLREAGFARVDMYADFGWTPPDGQSARIFYAAVKE